MRGPADWSVFVTFGDRRYELGNGYTQDEAERVVRVVGRLTGESLYAKRQPARPRLRLLEAA
jgi:hypothetical protein